MLWRICRADLGVVVIDVNASIGEIARVSKGGPAATCLRIAAPKKNGIKPVIVYGPFHY